MKNKYPNPYPTFSGQPLPQREYEITELISLIKQKQCNSMLEIGSRYGDSLYRITCECFAPKSKIRVIELPDGPWGNSKSLPLLQSCISELKSKKYNCNLFIGDSTKESAIDYAKINAPFDIVFIDGDHRYEGVKKDFYNYKDMASKMIVFHDIDKEGQLINGDDSLGVGILWNEIKCNYNHIEIVCPKQRGMGIGVILLQ